MLFFIYNEYGTNLGLGQKLLSGQKWLLELLVSVFLLVRLEAPVLVDQKRILLKPDQVIPPDEKDQRILPPSKE